MAQDQNTVTYISPTPPTNLLCVFGGSPPSTAGLVAADDGAAAALNAVVDPSNGNVAEAKGAIVTVTAPGSRAECPTQAISTLGNYVWLGPPAGPPTSPNNEHASGKAPTVLPTITGLLPVAPVSGVGNVTLTVNGTGFQPDSVVTIAGVPYQTQFNSPTQLSVQQAPKKATAGNSAITVVTGGTATAPTNWVFS